MEYSQQDIIKRILNDATQEAELIVKKAEKSAKLLLNKQRQTAQNQAQKEANSILKKAKNEAEIIRGKTSIDIRRQAEWALLFEKNRLIQNVIDTVNDRLEDLKKTPRYVPLLEKLTVEAGSVLGGGQLTVYLTQKDTKIKLDFTKLSKEITKKTGSKTKISRSKEYISTSGVLVKKAEDKIFVENTFKSILKRQQKNLKPKIAKILFGSIDITYQSDTLKT